MTQKWQKWESSGTQWWLECVQCSPNWRLGLRITDTDVSSIKTFICFLLPLLIKYFLQLFRPQITDFIRGLLFSRVSWNSFKSCSQKHTSCVQTSLSKENIRLSQKMFPLCLVLYDWVVVTRCVTTVRAAPPGARLAVESLGPRTQVTGPRPRHIPTLPGHCIIID